MTYLCYKTNQRKKCADYSIKTINIKAVADILGHHITTEITERYYVKNEDIAYACKQMRPYAISELVLLKLAKIKNMSKYKKTGLNVVFKPVF